jgi:hypothetical protein
MAPGLDPRVSHGHWKTAAFIAALRHGGIAAPFVLDGPINGEWFLAYVKEVLDPALSPGDIVRPGNSPPGSHNKGLKIKKAIDATGAGLHFLPLPARLQPHRSPGEPGRCSRNLRPSFEKPPDDLPKPSGAASASSPAASPRTNAKTTLRQQDMDT